MTRKESTLVSSSVSEGAGCRVDGVILRFGPEFVLELDVKQTCITC